MALERLAQLAGENPAAPLTCCPTALYLTSSMHGHGADAESDRSKHQRLELHRNGDCRLVDHCLDEYGRSIISSDAYISIPRDEAVKLLDLASAWMSGHCCDIYGSNRGAWTLLIEDESGCSHQAYGAPTLADDTLARLSRSLRFALNRSDLLAFSPLRA